MSQAAQASVCPCVKWKARGDFPSWASGPLNVETRLFEQTVIVYVYIFRRKETRSLTTNQIESRPLNGKGKAVQDLPSCLVVETIPPVGF